MVFRNDRYAPGRVRDAVFSVLASAPEALSVKEIEDKVELVIGRTPTSSVRSYLRLNTPELFVREKRGVYRVRKLEPVPAQEVSAEAKVWRSPATIGGARLFHGDCFAWLGEQEDRSFHAVVTDPPYGLHEYTSEQQEKLRNRKGGVWRIPPSYDGNARAQLARFTTL